MTSSPTDADRTPRVLVADNDEAVVEMLTEFLRRRGLDVTVASDGEVALERLGAERFDLLVCDLDMPVMSGDELLRRIRTRADSPPVLVISGYVDEFAEDDLLANPHVRRVFRKPFDVRAFVEVADDLARGRGGGGADPGIGSDPGPGSGLF